MRTSLPSGEGHSLPTPTAPTSASARGLPVGGLPPSAQAGEPGLSTPPQSVAGEVACEPILSSDSPGTFAGIMGKEGLSVGSC